MLFFKNYLLLFIAIILVSFNLRGQSDSAYTSKYYTIYSEILNPIDKEKTNGERIFQPYIKEIIVDKNSKLYDALKIVQVDSFFWFVKKDSLLIFDLDGLFIQGKKLIDSELNSPPSYDEITNLTYDGNFVYAVNNNENKTIFVIEPISKSIINKIHVSGFESEFSSGSPYNMRWITYDASADSSRGGFWVGSYNDNFFQIDKLGNILDTISVTNNTIGEIYSAFYDNNTPNGPFLWCYRRIGYSPNDLDIIAISLKKDSTFGRILHTKESIVFDVDIFNYHHPRSGYVYINKGFVNSQDVILVYSTGRYIRCYPMSFPTIDVSVDPFVTTSTYTQWPLYAIDTVWFKGKINNASPFTQFGAELTLNIVKDGAIEQSFIGTYNLQPFENKEVVFGPYFPTSMGIYTLESHASLAGDEDANNDNAISTFAITDSTYGRDTWNFLTNPAEFVDYKFMWGPDLGLSGDGGSDEQGALFTIDKPMLLTSVSAFLKPTEANDITTFDIHKINFSYIRAEPFAQTIPFSAKIEDTGIIKQYTIPMESGGVRLGAGTYFINIKEGHSPNRMIYTRNNYVPYINKYYGDDLYYYEMEGDDNIRGALTIRPNFACKNELLAPSIIQSNQTLTCNTQYTDLKFQWYKNNVPVGGATNKNFYPRGEAGKYSVLINKENCYQMSAVFEIVTGIFNNETQNLSIFPNPTNDKVYISTDATMNGDMEIQVLDILGKTINTQIIKNITPNQTIPIDLITISTGVYIIHAKIGEQSWEGRLVVE
ncbi:MAG: T9SS type A sorting domain-containing protein [Bacteroidetes bacterium]|nr:T9SS type A sorting domain-containing protein [Bacteroidota bacterium]MBK8674675.1 T9SS type A sorting domain-containing protein [Bacteroidota bacterium]MBK9353201.1 T9SS type A sorting domain-containing protein [Bacteroidota bacterium]MBK9634658.1 T9SS type A sorting domain-containing protein [Bacteroidota bacterium]MBL0080340.1 T9SS type A sorting domain-containing protein [Bacteroidota bacterium]